MAATDQQQQQPAEEPAVSRIFHRIRAGADPNGGRVITPQDAASVPAWMQCADRLHAAADALPRANKENLRILANIGVQYARLQADTAAALEAASGVDVPAELAQLEAALAATPGPYLLGDGALLSVADLSVACAALDLLSLVYTVRPYPHVTRWFAACFSIEAALAELGPQRALGARRIGGQIDRRPDPVECFKAATKSIALNKGQKKKQSQRQKEKAAKEKKAKNKQGSKKAATASSGGGGGAAAAPAAATYKYGLGGRVEIVAGKQARMAACHAQLEVQGIEFRCEPHAATPTVDELIKAIGHLEGGHCKNLFLKAKKKSRTRDPDTKIWLVVALHDTQVNMKAFSKSYGYKDALRRGNAALLDEKLGVVQGEVSPLALMNNPQADVQVAIDSRMMDCKQLWFHPLTFEASTAISPAGLTKWIHASGREFEVVDFGAL